MFASRRMEPVTAGIGFECGGSDANGGPRGNLKRRKDWRFKKKCAGTFGRNSPPLNPKTDLLEVCNLLHGEGVARKNAGCRGSRIDNRWGARNHPRRLPDKRLRLLCCREFGLRVKFSLAFAAADQPQPEAGDESAAAEDAEPPGQRIVENQQHEDRHPVNPRQLADHVELPGVAVVFLVAALDHRIDRRIHLGEKSFDPLLVLRVPFSRQEHKEIEPADADRDQYPGGQREFEIVQLVVALMIGGEPLRQVRFVEQEHEPDCTGEAEGERAPRRPVRRFFVDMSNISGTACCAVIPARCRMPSS